MPAAKPSPIRTPGTHAGAAEDARDPQTGHDMSAMGGATMQHPSSEKGNPLVDMQTMTPTSKLDDPGIGLREQRPARARRTPT